MAAFHYITITILLFHLYGSALGNEVKQFFPSVFQKRDESETLPCLHTYSSYSIILWYKQSVDGGLMFLGYYQGMSPNVEPDFQKMDKITMNGAGNANKYGNLTINRLEGSDSAVYFCATNNNYNPAHFGSGTKLTVLEKDPIYPTYVKVLPPSGGEVCDKSVRKTRKSVTLLCVASGFYPDHVTVFWEVSGFGQDQIKVGTDEKALHDEKKNLYSITSRLRIPIKKYGNPKTRITCYVQFYNGTIYTNYTDSISGRTVAGIADPDTYIKSGHTAKFAYSIFIAKSILFGVFICFFVWKTSRGSKEKW